MKPSRLLIATVVAVAASTAFAQSGLNDPMTKAMMDVYNQELQSNPDNYEIYFRRANEYYKFNQYLRALSDIDNAILHAPKGDADMLFQCHLLRGEIYQMLEKPAEALSDFTKALSYDPTSFMALYQKANCEYELGKYAEAKADYNRLRANNGRSAEALTGLARVAIKENNLGLASEYMDDAVAMMPADSDIYVRRSGIRRELGNNTGAVDDLIMAISIDSNPKAFQELINVSNSDYPAVITALSNAIHQAPEQGMFYYIRGVIAQAHDHFPSAIADFRKLIDENMYNYAGIYASLGECYYALCDFPAALENINHAIGMTSENGEYFIALARVYRAQDRLDDAMRAIGSALEKVTDRTAAITEKGRILYSQKQYDEAAGLFGELTIDVSGHKVMVSGKEIDLTASEFKLLTTLARHPGRVYNRMELVEKVLGYDFEGYERTIDSHVKNLRAKLGDDPKKPKWLYTVHGVGYRFEAPAKTDKSDEK